MVDDTLGYHTREVVSGDRDGSSGGAPSRTLYTDGFNVLRDDGDILRRSATLSETTSSAATRAALLTPGISARWRSHRCVGEGL
jgi:hypothetical protein